VTAKIHIKPAILVCCRFKPGTPKRNSIVKVIMVALIWASPVTRLKLKINNKSLSIGTNQVIGGESKLTLVYQYIIPFFSAF